ncbi:hypothetical protein [Candidatus Enterococcus clewellii]|uniref:Uncharacterized protein n=1 Tax=Candidatus Enterococcus clewellii TaxID=1834193 RepID=A0A242K7X6_9ENTE|nr:hypothetical protein [Enterococcus sp. 9E7_DIV0242]OTP17271.1 hypothetical protein A5888_001409 [Enterococcus sp. 9E7_DIV0242]
MKEHQKVVLNYLKKLHTEKNPPFLIFTRFGWEHFGAELPEDVAENYRKFNDEEEFEVLREFCEWGLEVTVEVDTSEAKAAFDDMFDDSVHKFMRSEVE